MQCLCCLWPWLCYLTAVTDLTFLVSLLLSFLMTKQVTFLSCQHNYFTLEIPSIIVGNNSHIITFHVRSPGKRVHLYLIQHIIHVLFLDIYGNKCMY